MDTLIDLKIALNFLLFFFCYSKYCRSSQLTLSMINCFTRGVFLSMALIHILPEAVEKY